MFPRIERNKTCIIVRIDYVHALVLERPRRCESVSFARNVSPVIKPYASFITAGSYMLDEVYFRKILMLKRLAPILYLIF